MLVERTGSGRSKGEIQGLSTAPRDEARGFGRDDVSRGRAKVSLF